MTPFEEMGWKKGDVFRVISDGGNFPESSIVTLYKDDGSNVLHFKGCGGVRNKTGATHEYIPLNRLERIWAMPPEKVKVMIGTIETEISMESALALKESLKDL